VAESAPGKVGVSPSGSPNLDPMLKTPEAFLNLVNERKKHSTDKLNPLFRKTARWYDLYRGTYTARGQLFRNNITIPFIFSVIQSDVARKAQISFGSWPIVEFTGYSHADSYIARKNEVLVSAQMKDCDSFRKAVDFFTGADMYGTAICRVGWKQERELAQLRIRDQGGQEQIVQKMMNRFDGPDWQVRDIMDSFVQPGKRTIQEMDWYIDRYWMEFDALKRDAALGIYDPAAIKALEMAGPTSDVEQNFAERRSIYRTYGDYDMRRGERFAKPVEILEMWGLVPADMAQDGFVHRVITIANGKILLRNKPNPFWHGQIPFISYCPMPDPHYFHGPGKIEICEKMQFAANRFANQKMDGLDLAIDNMYVVDRTRGIDTQNLFSKAGKVIGVNGPVDDSVIRPLSPDLRGMEMAYTEIGTLWQWIQQGTGIIEDTVQGAPASRRQTKAEFQGRQENVLTRLTLESRLAEEGFVEPLANMFVALNRQFLSVPMQVPILGSDAVVNPITGYPMPQEPIDMDLSDINHNYKARAVGATQMLGKGAKQQNLLALMQIMGGNPVGAAMVNWAAFLRQVFEAFDMRNFDELINQQPTQAGQAATGEPESAVNQALAPPDLGTAPGHGDLSPDTTSAILQELEGQLGGM
jgi:hypothetical protein